jgi:hypothetical protein
LQGVPGGLTVLAWRTVRIVLAGLLLAAAACVEAAIAFGFVAIGLVTFRGGIGVVGQGCGLSVGAAMGWRINEYAARRGCAMLRQGFEPQNIARKRKAAGSTPREMGTWVSGVHATRPWPERTVPRFMPQGKRRAAHAAAKRAYGGHMGVRRAEVKWRHGSSLRSHRSRCARS